MCKLHGKDVKSRECRRLVKKCYETEVNDQKGSEASLGSGMAMPRNVNYFRPRHGASERKHRHE